MPELVDAAEPDRLQERINRLRANANRTGHIEAMNVQATLVLAEAVLLAVRVAMERADA